MKKILLSIIFLSLTTIINAQCYESLNFGGGHTIGKTTNGFLWGWGYGLAGQLLTFNETEPNPIQVGTSNDWNKVYNGVINTFAIKNNGTLWGCGSNQHGSLGVNSSTQNFTSFQQITTATNWVKVAPSYFYTIALKADGTIWGWGLNNNYQTGNTPASLNQPIPLQIGTDTDWVEIATGTNDTSFAIKSNGTIWGWGSNPSSIIVSGSGTTTVSTPTQVGTDTDWVKMSVGGGHILAQKQNGTLWSWGGGDALGVGGTPPVTNIPQQVTTDTWKSFSTGTGTSFGIKSDGTLWAWGFNGQGQLGDGTTINRLVPTQIGADTNWNTVQARNFYTTMATKTDGSIWYWGTNYYGEFGNGTDYDTNYYISPQQTLGICVTPLSTPIFQQENVFTMYPNPAKDVVTLQYDLAINNATVSIFDVTGRLIQNVALNSFLGTNELNVSAYPAGVYLVLVKQGAEVVSSSKLVVE
jgi:alpha-tubulin suppressor-like RCC1 family protein